MTIEPNLLADIFTRLRERPRLRAPLSPPPELPSFLERGWIYMLQVEDYGVHFDRRPN